MNQRGFTLVEFVVVIAVLGGLAAVAAPKFLDASRAAIDNDLKQSLAIVRDAIEIYAADHAGSLPPCTDDGEDFRAALEPYMSVAFPKCPVGPANNHEVLPVVGRTTDGVAAPKHGWAFNTNDGAFICNLAAETKGNSEVNYDDL